MTPRSRYSTVAIVLHWAIAAAILFQLVLGWRMEHDAKGPTAYAMVQLHKSIGITILLLSLARLGWRLLNPPPPAPEEQRAWERAASRIVHAAFYVIMIGLPLTGWIMVSTSRIAIPTLLYGTVPWPHVPGLHDLAPAVKARWNSASDIGHHLLVFLTLGLLVLHLGAVAKHQLIDRDSVFSHMAPKARPGWAEPRLFLVAAAALAVLAAAFTYWPAPKMVAAAAIAPVASEPIPPSAAVASPPIVADAAPVSAGPAPAATETVPEAVPVKWAVQPGGALGFEASWSGQAISGRFARWDADIDFSPDALEASRIRVTIDIASASTGDEQRDSSLPSADWFDVAAHRKATFVASQFRATGPGRYEARGTLTLRGVSKPLLLTFTLKISGDTATANGTATIDRTQFGVGQGEWAATDQIAAAVKVTFALTAKR